MEFALAKPLPCDCCNCCEPQQQELEPLRTEARQELEPEQTGTRTTENQSRPEREPQRQELRTTANRGQTENKNHCEPRPDRTDRKREPLRTEARQDTTYKSEIIIAIHLIR